MTEQEKNSVVQCDACPVRCRIKFDGQGRATVTPTLMGNWPALIRW